MKCPLLIFIPLILAPLISYATTLTSMTGQQIKSAFVGKTITSIGTDNLNGKTINTSNSVYLGENANAYGTLGIKPEGLPQFDHGNYHIQKDGTIHITWAQWDFSKKLCFHLFETKNAYLSIDCEGVYHSTFMKSEIRKGKTF